MNRISALLSCFIFVLALWGCEQQNKGISSQPQLESESRENVFPESMVGVWEVVVNEYSGSKWGIKFEPDGSILKIIHSLAGPVNVTEGGVYLEGPEPNTYAVFVMGPCEAKYYPEIDELGVKIILEHYEMKLPTGVLEGRIESYFSGPVSKDGQTWAVDLREYGWLEGAAAPDPKIIDQNPKKLVFTKIDLK